MDFSDQSVVLHRIKAECDGLLSDSFMADMSAALYPSAGFSPASHQLFQHPMTAADFPPVSTPVRPPPSQQHQQTNDSGISPGSTGAATNSSSGEDKTKNHSESGGEDLPAHSPFSLPSSDEDEMAEEEEDDEEDMMLDDEDDDLLAEEGGSSRGGSSDLVGDALSRLERALMTQQQPPQQQQTVGISSLTCALPAESSGNATTVYQCNMCSYTASSRFHFQAHLNSHFDVKCSYCDFTARTEGKLRAHMRNAHSDMMDDGVDVNSRPSARSNSGGGGGGGKLKSHKCKHPDCGFVAKSKMDFWDHSRSHIKAEKLLACPHCPFVTEYKHHLDYHTRNHLNSKPFKCQKCSYSCVNKSMLNSHMKSHSNVYQVHLRRLLSVSCPSVTFFSLFSNSSAARTAPTPQSISTASSSTSASTATRPRPT